MVLMHGVDLLGRASPAPVQPFIQTRRRVGAQDAVRLELEDPLYTREEFVVETSVGQQAVNVLLGLDRPRLGKDHQVQLANDLLVLDAVAPRDAYGALVGADEQESPVRRHDRRHMQQLGNQVRERTRLDDERKLRRIVSSPRVVGRIPVDLDLGNLLPRLIQS